MSKFCLLLAHVFYAAVSVNPPVILVPGLLGSVLEMKLHNAKMPHMFCTTNTKGEWKRLWLNPFALLPVQKECTIDQLTLIYNASDDSYANLPGVELRAKGFGSGFDDWMYKFEFGHMTRYLRSALGYSLGDDLFLAPYDWRLAGDAHSRRTNGVGGFYPQLQTLIEKAVQNRGRRAVVLSHSLGGPTMLFFFHNFVTDAWKAKHIESWFALSCPWLGSSIQLAAYLSGYNLGASFVPHSYVRKVQVKSASGVWLSPHPAAFGDAPLVITPSRNYSAADVAMLVSMVGESSGGQQVLKMMAKNTSDLSRIQSPPTNVRVFNWYSTGVQTGHTFVYDSDIQPGFDKAPKWTSWSDGDGVVNRVSLSVPERLWPSVASSPLQTRVFSNCSHFGILSDIRMLQALEDYLMGVRVDVHADWLLT